MVNVRKAAAISILSIVPLVRGATLEIPVSPTQTSSTIFANTSQPATNITNIQRNIAIEEAKLISLQRKLDIAKLNKLLQNEKPKDIEMLIQKIKVNRISNNSQNEFPSPFEQGLIIASSASVSSLIIFSLLSRMRSKGVL